MRKMVQGGGVSLNKEKLTDQNRPITSDDLIDGKYLLAQRGKKNYYLLIVKWEMRNEKWGIEMIKWLNEEVLHISGKHFFIS